MAMRIAPRPEPLSIAKTRPVKRGDYLSWLHTLPCIITKQHGVEAAHVSFARPELGHLGRGKSQKASDRWALPMDPRLHMEQHKHNEQAWWRAMDKDPHMACLILWGLWSDYGEDATEAATRIIMEGIG